MYLENYLNLKERAKFHMEHNDKVALLNTYRKLAILDDKSLSDNDSIYVKIQHLMFDIESYLIG